MSFDLVPRLSDAEWRAVRAALTRAGLLPDAAPTAYGSPWRLAAAREATGQGTSEWPADDGCDEVHGAPTRDDGPRRKRGSDP
jgi:hypothetical protein